MQSFQPYTIQQNGSEATKTSTKNVGGAVINVGGTTSLVTNIKLGYNNVNVFGSTVIRDTVTSGDYAAVASSGSPNFAYNNQKPIAKRYSTTIAGTGNNILQSAAGSPGLIRSIHRIETLRTNRIATSVRNGAWNIFTGKFSPLPTVAVDAWYSNETNSTSATSTDSAASVSRDSTGSYSYKLGQKVPFTSGYEPKTS
jgi:hypothetical protein